MTIEPADLRDPAAFYQHGFDRGYLDDAIKGRLASGVRRESDLTTAMASAVGSAADVMIDFLLEKTGLGREEGWLYLLKSRADLQVGTHRVQTFGSSGPDLFVSRRRLDDPDGAVSGDPLVAVEVKKRTASWNGHPDACPSGLHPTYGAQMFCYPMGCWLKPFSRGLVAVRYLWLDHESRCVDFRDGAKSRLKEEWNLPDFDQIHRLEVAARTRLWHVAELESLLEHFENSAVPANHPMREVVCALL
ncbi:hypothetical protein ACLQ3K_24190 [Tsukamurella sp. DT100]|uniref:hypothetical protein n=1 Tax=Tsukamurella sp. DT100 TaxID=3393415 RepID=UPI003CEF2886